MKTLNITAGVLLAALLVWSFCRPVAPPEDPWFQQAVVNQPRLVLVKFGADWCPPCRRLEPVLDELGDRLGKHVKVVRIDIDERPELAAHYGVSGIPRLFLFQSGRVTGTRTGFQTRDELDRWIGPHLH